MSVIRTMREDDLDAVRRLEAAAFGAWLKELKGPQTADLPLRTRTNVQLCRARDPEGCFVAEEDGRLLGFIFSRTWGSVGWFGTFSVLPECQGRGTGKQLIDASLDYLRREPGRLIGLETMPERPYNLGLYLRRGFQARYLTLSLGKELKVPAAVATRLRDRFLGWSGADGATQQRWLEDLRAACGQIRPGLDYSKEIVLSAQHDVGRTLVLVDDGSAVGFSTVLLANSREVEGEMPATVPALALHPRYASEDAFRALLVASEAIARAHGKPALVVPVNAAYPWALERLLAWGYRVERAMVRMVLSGTEGAPPPAGCVDLSRFAG